MGGQSGSGGVATKVDIEGQCSLSICSGCSKKLVGMSPGGGILTAMRGLQKKLRSSLGIEKLCEAIVSASIKEYKDVVVLLQTKQLKPQEGRAPTITRG